MNTVSPIDVLHLGFSAIRASDLCSKYGLQLKGADVEITSLLHPTRFPMDTKGVALTYATSPDSRNYDKVVVIAKGDWQAPSTATMLITTANPREVFFSILLDLAKQDRFRKLPAHRSSDITIAKTAVIHDNVHIEKHATIGDGAVILPNTYIGENVIIGPNTVVGAAPGFALEIAGTWTRVPNVGGVWLSKGSELGGSACIDKGLCGEFTFIGEQAKIDNLNHIAAGAIISARCSLPGASAVAPRTKLEEDVWIGPKTAIAEDLLIGANTYVGTGCIITTDMPPHALVYGMPSRMYGWACICRNKLEFTDEKATCKQCGRRFEQIRSEGKQVGVRQLDGNK